MDEETTIAQGLHITDDSAGEFRSDNISDFFALDPWDSSLSCAIQKVQVQMLPLFIIEYKKYSLEGKP